MIKTTVLNNKFIEEKEITFKEAKDIIESYFLLSDNVKDVNISTLIPCLDGIGATFNNHIDINNLYDCFKRVDDYIVLEFKEFTNTIAIKENCNIKLDFINNRLYLLDYHITIYFN